MRNTRGPAYCPYCKGEYSTNDTRHVSNISRKLSPAQMELLQFADSLDGPDLVKSLQLLHNIALYHSQHPIDEEEKNALHSAKLLWERIAAISEGS